MLTGMYLGAPLRKKERLTDISRGWREAFKEQELESKRYRCQFMINMLGKGKGIQSLDWNSGLDIQKNKNDKRHCVIRIIS
jgi:hypothetical protein